MDHKSVNSSCCVEDCRNSESNFERNVKFYPFPNKFNEEERKQQWLIAINRRNPDGSLWTPNAGSRICSEHFVGGRKSDIPTNVAYVPSIFKFDKLSITDDCRDTIVEKFTRVRKVYSLSSLKKMLNCKRNNAETQVNFDFDRSVFEFMSCVDSDNMNTKMIQCNIGYNFLNCVVQKDKSCGPDGMLLSDILCDPKRRKVVMTKRVENTDLI